MNRYEIKHYSEFLGSYRDKEWAIHSAGCFASFYHITIAVVDKFTGEVVAIRQPKGGIKK